MVADTGCGPEARAPRALIVTVTTPFPVPATGLTVTNCGWFGNAVQLGLQVGLATVTAMLKVAPVVGTVPRLVGLTLKGQLPS